MNPIQWLADRLSPYRSESIKTADRAVSVGAYRALLYLSIREPVQGPHNKSLAEALWNADIESAPYIDEAIELARSLFDMGDS